MEKSNIKFWNYFASLLGGLFKPFSKACCGARTTRNFEYHAALLTYIQNGFFARFIFFPFPLLKSKEFSILGKGLSNLEISKVQNGYKSAYPQKISLWRASDLHSDWSSWKCRNCFVVGKCSVLRRLFKGWILDRLVLDRKAAFTCSKLEFNNFRRRHWKYLGPF